MKLTGNTLLITGGASGIGLAFAERFVQRGNHVIICGRRADKLAEAKAKHPVLTTRVCDVANESDRIALANWIVSEHPETNVLVNNAGIQRRIDFASHGADWSDLRQELAINVDGPLHLTSLLLPHLLKAKDAAIINVTSGLAFNPMVHAPIYCATKAFLHSYTLTLRAQLAGKGVHVIEVAPPAVNTDLGGAGLHTWGAPLDEFADAIFKGFEAGADDIGFGFTEQSVKRAREDFEAFQARLR